MSKKINENKNIDESKGIISFSPDKFSFLELDKFLNTENIQKINIEKLSKKKHQNEKNETEKKQNLKIKPNSNIAREQAEDDMMYIEKQEDLMKEEPLKETKQDNKTEKEKVIPKKNVEKKKVDKRIVTINLQNQIVDKTQKNKDEKMENKKDYKKQNKYNIESIIKDIKEKDPKAYTPVLLPFEKDNNKESDLKEDFNENDVNNQNKLFIFQFPRQIPIKDLKSQVEKKEEENVNEEPKYDERGFLITPEFVNTFKEIKENTVIGKFVIMKSGKIKIKMGDIYFDINQGSLTKFAQYSAVITDNGNNENQVYILGQPMKKKLIVTPEFD